MYLELCGDITEKDGGYDALFQPEKYAVLRDPQFSEQEVIPEYIVIETLAQMACRSCKIHYSVNSRMVPVQLKHLKFFKKIFRANIYLIRAEVSKKHLFYEALVSFSDPEGNVYVEGSIVTAKMK